MNSERAESHLQTREQRREISAPAVAVSGSGGTFTSGIRRVTVSYVNANSSKITVPSQETVVSIAPNGSITVTSPSTFSSTIPSSLSTQYMVGLTPAGGASGSEVSCGNFNLGSNATITVDCGGSAVAQAGENVTVLVPVSGIWAMTNSATAFVDANNSYSCAVQGLAVALCLVTRLATRTAY